MPSSAGSSYWKKSYGWKRFWLAEWISRIELMLCVGVCVCVRARLLATAVQQNAIKYSEAKHEVINPYGIKEDVMSAHKFLANICMYGIPVCIPVHREYLYNIIRWHVIEFHGIFKDVNKTTANGIKWEMLRCKATGRADGTKTPTVENLFPNIKIEWFVWHDKGNTSMITITRTDKTLRFTRCFAHRRWNCFRYVGVHSKGIDFRRTITKPNRIQRYITINNAHVRTEYNSGCSRSKPISVV